MAYVIDISLRNNELQAIITTHKINDNRQYAFYLYKDGKVIDRIWYTSKNTHTWELNEPNYYRVQGFIRKNDDDRDPIIVATKTFSFVKDAIIVSSDVYNEVVRQETVKRNKVVSAIPKTTLSQKHINNTKFYLDRISLLKLFDKGSICAEIGVDKGEFSRQILNTVSPAKFHLIDCWESERYKDSYYSVINNLKDEIERAIVEINRGNSTEVLETFNDGYFDWVYIDTAHSYATTKAELEICHRKIRKGGIIAGHDFIIGNWVGNVKYGVIEAVYEFCKKYDYEIIGISSELNFTSFAIRQLII